RAQTEVGVVHQIVANGVVVIGKGVNTANVAVEAGRVSISKDSPVGIDHLRQPAVIGTGGLAVGVLRHRRCAGVDRARVRLVLGGQSTVTVVIVLHLISDRRSSGIRIAG